MVGLVLIWRLRDKKKKKKKYTPKLIQVVGKIQFLVVLGLKSPVKSLLDIIRVIIQLIKGD